MRAVALHSLDEALHSRLLNCNLQDLIQPNCFRFFRPSQQSLKCWLLLKLTTGTSNLHRSFAANLRLPRLVILSCTRHFLRRTRPCRSSWSIIPTSNQRPLNVIQRGHSTKCCFDSTCLCSENTKARSGRIRFQAPQSHGLCSLLPCGVTISFALMAQKGTLTLEKAHWHFCGRNLCLIHTTVLTYWV